MGSMAAIVLAKPPKLGTDLVSQGCVVFFLAGFAVTSDLYGDSNREL